MRDLNLICVGELMIHLWISIDTMIKKTYTKDLRKNTLDGRRLSEKEKIRLCQTVNCRALKTQSFYLLFIVVHVCCLIVVSVLTDVLCLKVKLIYFSFDSEHTENNTFFSQARVVFLCIVHVNFFFLLITSGSRPGNAHLSPFLSKVVRFPFRLR